MAQGLETGSKSEGDSCFAIINMPSYTDPSLSPLGELGWGYKGVKLINFGRTGLFQAIPTVQQFVADWPVYAKDCFEMRENNPWTHQADYYGLAGIVYCLLFGKYIEASSVTIASSTLDKSFPIFKISTPFKRYRQSILICGQILSTYCSILAVSVIMMGIYHFARNLALCGRRWKFADRL